MATIPPDPRWSNVPACKAHPLGCPDGGDYGATARALGRVTLVTPRDREAEARPLPLDPLAEVAAWRQRSADTVRRR